MGDQSPTTQRRSPLAAQLCAICDSPALGMNFGVLTCAPCKAFFRRNARRREVTLDTPYRVHPRARPLSFCCSSWICLVVIVI